MPAEFGFSDQDGDGFYSVVVNSLRGGHLFVNGSQLALPDTVAFVHIVHGALQFVADPNLNGDNSAGITFQVTDGPDSSNLDPTPNTITFNIDPVADLTARDDSFSTDKNTPLSASVAANTRPRRAAC